MTWYFIAAVILLIAAAFVVSRSSRPSVDSGAFVSRKPLTEPEQTLYWRLRQAMPECVVLSQVTFSRFIKAAGAHSGKQRLRNQVAQKSVDFLVCLPDFTLVAAVELDDSTHQRARDVRRDAILKSAGVPLVRLHVREIPSVAQLRGLFIK